MLFQDALTRPIGLIIVTVIQAITLLSFAVFSIVDLRTRLVPFIEAFFVISGGCQDHCVNGKAIRQPGGRQSGSPVG